MDGEERTELPFGIRPEVSRWVFLGMLALFGLGMLAYGWLKPSYGPPPPAIARDPLLVRGRELYLERCVSCHGLEGKGDGPLAKNLKPPPGNLAVAEWKHGNRPDQVVPVVAQGVPDTAMPGWRASFGPEGVRAVTAYVYHLAGRSVPEELRNP